MKVFIVLAGLMVIVPRIDDKGIWRELNVLVLDPTAAEESPPSPPKDPLHQHFPKVTSFGGKDHFDLKGEWTIDSNSPRGIELRQSERFLFLGHLYDPPALPPLLADCKGSGAVATCKANNKPLLKAQLIFTGGWRIRPVEITHDREPRVDVLDDSTWGFLQYVDQYLPRATRHQVQLSSGLILESTGDAPVTIQVAGKPFYPAPLRKEACTVFAGHSDCVDPAKCCGVVRFLNTGIVLDDGKHDRVEIEHVQKAIYKLLVTPAVPIPHYFLFLRKTGSPEVMDILYPGGGGTITPERPCSPVIFLPAER